MNSTVSMECYGVLWSAINHQLVYIDLYRPSLCLHSKLVFPDEGIDEWESLDKTTVLRTAKVARDR